MVEKNCKCMYVMIKAKQEDNCKKKLMQEGAWQEKHFSGTQKHILASFWDTTQTSLRFSHSFDQKKDL